MSAIFGTALAGLNRATLGVEAVASNVANLNTPGYRAVRVDGGSGQLEHRASTPPSEIDEAETPDVDLATELIELKKQEQAFRANATLIDFENRRIGTILDIIG